MYLNISTRCQTMLMSCCRLHQTAKKALKSALAAEKKDNTATESHTTGRSQTLFSRLKAKRFRQIFDYLIAVQPFCFPYCCTLIQLDPFARCTAYKSHGQSKVVAAAHSSQQISSVLTYLSVYPEGSGCLSTGLDAAGC